jgi:hypothetical protein
MMGVYKKMHLIQIILYLVCSSRDCARVCTPFVLPVIVLGIVPYTFPKVKSKAIAVLIQPTSPEGEGEKCPRLLLL